AMDFGAAVFGPLGSRPETASMAMELLSKKGTSQLAQLRQSWINQLTWLPMSLEQRLDAFEIMTQVGGSVEAQDYFDKFIPGELKKAKATQKLVSRVKSLLRLQAEYKGKETVKFVDR